MKQSISTILLAVIAAAATWAADLGIRPYSAATGLSPRIDKALGDKLAQIIGTNGSGSMAAATPIVLTAKLSEPQTATTSTIPPKVAVKTEVVFYIGNAADNGPMLSTAVRVSGVGNNKEEALLSALNRIRPADQAIASFISDGKRRVAAYYESSAPSMLAEARLAADMRDYDAAYAILLAIPSFCSHYSDACKLVLELMEKENYDMNRETLTRARTAWASSPDRSGAEAAREILDGLVMPVDRVTGEVDSLLAEMSKKLGQADEQERKARASEAERLHQREMEALKIARIRAANQPKTEYHIHWW